MKREPKKVILKVETDAEPKVEKSQPMPSLITLNEFVLTLSKQRMHHFESLGSFVYWIKKDGCPNRWPFDMWKQKFDEFLSKKT